MQYKLTASDVVKAFFQSKNIFMTILFTCLFLLPIFLIGSVLPMDDPITLIIIVAALILPMATIIPMGLKGGWSISGENFDLKAFTTNKTIKIADMQIELVAADSEWKPSIRTWGMGLPGLLVGKCRLKNKQSALVFCHADYSQILVIRAEGEYYLIGHPGVEGLYGELIRLGAKAMAATE